MSIGKEKQETEFNIFKVARIYKSEGIHTRVIAELINPHSRFHKNGQFFLNMFLEIVGEKIKLNITDFKGAFVETEVYTCEGRFIDMVISTDKYYIPFEIKIWAKDQPNQLASYYKFAQQKGIVPVIFYLTPSGHSPSIESRGDLLNSDICCISFKEHILSWLDKCIELDVSQDVLQILKQLRNNIGDGFSLVKNEGDSLLNIIQSKLSEREITECASTYLTIRLNKKGLLEIALRISIDRKKRTQVKLQIICGVEQMNKISSYSNTSTYIENHQNELMELIKETFNPTIHIETAPNRWSRFEKSFETNNADDEFIEKCYLGICEILDNCLNV